MNKNLHYRLRLSAPAIAAALLALTGCTVGPDYKTPDTQIAPAWTEIGPAAKPAVELPPGLTPPVTSAATANPIKLAEWWTTFKDPALDSLIDRAVKSNLDLRKAQARVREARAQLGVTSADLLPTVDANGSYKRSRTSKNTSPFGPLGEEHDLYHAGFDASWEIDVFGGQRRSIEASDADLAASIEDRRDVLVSLLAEVARNYVTLRAAQREVVIARENLQTQRETLDLTRTRLDAGIATDLDVARSEAQVQATASTIPSLESTARQSMHALGVLLGQEPGSLTAELTRESPIPAAPPEVPMGLPSELLRRRPDLRRAERQLAAATARIGVATADLFPKFSLTGSLGLESATFKKIGNFESRFWSIGPSVSWTILDFGRIRNNIDVQGAREQQALANYDQQVLTSLREVEDALVRFSQEQSRRQSLAGAVSSNQRALKLADQLYKQGQTDFLSVLDVQRNLFIAQDALVQSDRAVSVELISLYKALGGGWEIESRATESTTQENAKPVAAPAEGK